MGHANDKTTNNRLTLISNQLKEMRFAEGRNQGDFTEFGISRRQIQRGEHGCNITLVSLFSLIDLYGYRLDEFFQGME